MRRGGRGSTSPTFTAATYNVHGWIGSGGHPDPARTAAVIRELAADVVGLQEAALLFGDASAPAEPGATAGYLAEQTGMEVIAGPTVLRGNHHYGNLLLSAHPIQAVRRHDLSVPGREPRGLLDVTVAVKGAAVRALVTHLGLDLRERRHQVRRLMEVIRASPSADDVLLMGDLNQWFPWLGPLSPVNRWFGASPLRRSFPARWPLLPLDRIWIQPGSRLVAVGAHRSPAARLASDHLPVRAVIRTR